MLKLLKFHHERLGLAIQMNKWIIVIYIRRIGLTHHPIRVVLGPLRQFIEGVERLPSG